MAALRRYEKELLLAEDEGDVDDEETLGFYLYFTEGVNPLPHRNYPRFEHGSIFKNSLPVKRSSRRL